MDFFNDNNTEILIVNYNTPDYIIRLHSQIREYISSEITINIIDGSDEKLKIRGDEFPQLNKRMELILKEDKFTNHHLIGYNIHHGPGMDYGLKKIQKKYVLILDSDVEVCNKGLLNIFSKNITKEFYTMGRIVTVDDGGNNTHINGYEYVHPSTMMLDREFYMGFDIPFIKHGAPCLNFMKKINPKFLIDIKNIDDYVKYVGRGTRKFFGMNL